MMYAKLSAQKILGKTLDRLEVSIVNYNLGTSIPSISYNVYDSTGERITSGTTTLPKEVFDSWTNNDEIILENVAQQLNLEIIEIIGKHSKNSEQMLSENPTLETKY